jgi:serine/threonine protein kinase
VLRPGDLLSDRYRLDRFLASGGMGEVWSATDVVLGRVVAVKVLQPAVLTDPSFAVRFRHEARTLAAFHHPNVVDVYDFGEHRAGDRALAYLVMAYVDGEPLSHRIAARGRLPVAEAMSVVAQVGEALHAVHANGVVHRDIKPGNLLVRPDGTVVLVDFGVARSTEGTAITSADAVPGTVLYMAPEQVSGDPVSAATDVYALGAVAYHCLAGEPPFSGDAALEVALRHLHDDYPPLPADVPEPVRALVDRALAKNPADRFPTAGALAEAARAAVPAVPTGVAAVPAAVVVSGPTTRPDVPLVVEPEPTGRSPRRRAAIVTAVAGVLAAAGVAAVVALSPPSRAPAGVDRPAQSVAPASAAPATTTRARTGRPTRTAQSAGNPAAPTTGPAPGPAGSTRPPETTAPPTEPASASTAPSQADVAVSSGP